MPEQSPLPPFRVPPESVDLGGSFFIGDVLIEGRVALAPMAGVSVQAFRRQGRRYGASLVCSEMVSACGLHYGDKRTGTYLRIAADEHPIAVQLFGTRPELMAEAATMVRDAGADLIDINMGCPVKKVTKTFAGCAMTEKPDLAVAVAAACVDATDLPVMVKIRRGMKNGSRDCFPLAQRLVEEAGVSAITLHPRSAAQMYTGYADHALTAEMVDLLDVPVFASGDITSHARAREVIAATGCASVMIGRGAQGNPWALHEIATGEELQPSPDERVAELVVFIREVVREMGEKRAAGFLRKFYGWYLRGEGFGRSVRNELMVLPGPAEVEAWLLERYEGAGTLATEYELATAVSGDERFLDLEVSIYGGG